MWRPVFLALLPVAVRAQGFDISGLGNPITRQTTRGQISGRVTDDGIERYFGIPTAQDTSPAGYGRFTAPAPKQTWSDTLDTVFETQCIHLDEYYNVVGQEDCISVDVLVPPGAANVPVHVYIHGGGFYSQDPPAFDRIYYGFRQQASGDDARTLISVFFHYRLGALGGFAHPALSAASSYGGSGNWGMQDCINNLQWIQSNIANFGGDPTKVTVMGESAGAAMTSILTASPLSEGLFRAAIIESPFVHHHAGAYSLTAKYAMSSLWTAGNGCGDIGVASEDATWEVDCLRSDAVTPIMLTGPMASYGSDAFDAVYGEGSSATITYNCIHSWPAVDGYSLTYPPLEAWQNNIGSKINMIWGYNNDEYTTFYPDPTNDFQTSYYRLVDLISPMAMLNIGAKATMEDWVMAHMDLLGDTGMMLAIDSTAVDVKDPYLNAIHKATDAWFTNARLCTSTLIAQTRREPGTIWRFLYAQDPTTTVINTFGYPNFGACHGCELSYALGFYAEQYAYIGWGIMPQDYSNAEITMGNTMKSYWNNMFFDADPGTVNGLAWDPITLTERHMIVFKASYSNGAAVDPCIDTVACRVDATNDYRAKEALFFQDWRSLWHWFGPGPEDATVCAAGTSGGTQIDLVDPAEVCDPTAEYVYESAADSMLYGWYNTPDPKSYDPWDGEAPAAATYAAPDDSSTPAAASSSDAPADNTEEDDTDGDDGAARNRINDVVDDFKDVDHVLGVAAAALAVGVLALLTTCIICCCGLAGGAHAAGKGGSAGGNSDPV